MKQERKQKPIPIAEVVAWMVGLGLVCMFAAIGLFVTIYEIFN